MAVECLSPAAPHAKKVFALMPNHSVRTLLIACCVTALLTAAVVAGADEPSPQAKPTLANRLPAFHDLVRVDAAPLAALPIQGDSLSLFKTVVGPQLGLNDVAMTLGAKGLTPAMSQELLIPDLTKSANELVRGLAAWQLTQAAKDSSTSAGTEQRESLQRQIESQMTWLTEGTTLETPLRQLLALQRHVDGRHQRGLGATMRGERAIPYIGNGSVSTIGRIRSVSSVASHDCAAHGNGRFTIIRTIARKKRP